MKIPRLLQFELPFAPRPRTATAPARSLIAGEVLDYTLKRSRRRRSITLTVDESGLRVGAPWNASHREIDAVLNRHRDWVARKLAEWRERRPPPRRWRAGEAVMLLGSPLEIARAPACPVPTVDGERLLVDAAIADGGALEACVVEWLRTRALDCYRSRAAALSAALGVAMPAIRLSAARTRWGSCHATGRVLLNWRLIQCPLRLVDYVVAHELSHLKHMNHSRQFWNTVATLVPEHARLRAELRRDSSRYLWL